MTVNPVVHLLTIFFLFFLILLSAGMAQYNNAVLNITRDATPDPYVTFAHNKFYLTFTAGDRVAIWRADSLPGFHDHAEKHVIWRPPPHTHHSSDLWAPELHSLSGRWYIYYAAADPRHGNKSHRMYILGGPSSSSDPATCGAKGWEFLGPIVNMPQTQWAIDGTVITLNNHLYFIYSGWPLHNPSGSDLTQQLFIIGLSDPTTANSEPVMICAPVEGFERTGQHGINEGPQFLSSPTTISSQSAAAGHTGNSDRTVDWIGIIYSCAGSWTSQYKMNTLQYRPGHDPLDPKAWIKGSKPLITTDPAHDRGPWGPGHGSFLHIGDEVVGIYHATDGKNDGWKNRKARMQRVVFNANDRGEPHMGSVVGPLVPDITGFVHGSGPAGAGGGAAINGWGKSRAHDRAGHVSGPEEEKEEGVGSGDHTRHGFKAWLDRVRQEL